MPALSVTERFEILGQAQLREIPFRLLASRTDKSRFSTRQRNLLSVFTLITPASPC